MPKKLVKNRLTFNDSKISKYPGMMERQLNDWKTRHPLSEWKHSVDNSVPGFTTHEAVRK